MKREIKFRVFFYDGIDLSTGVWVSIQEAIQEGYVEFDKYTIVPTDQCSIIVEWTGLKDKNGKEIYEGDIIETRILKCEMGDNGMSFENYREFCGGHHIKKDRFVASMQLDMDNNLIYPEGQELPECFLPEEDAVPEEYKSFEEMKTDIGLFEIIGNIYENKNLNK